jgi:methyl-accepting chemotaxis protein
MSTNTHALALASAPGPLARLGTWLMGLGRSAPPPTEAKSTVEAIENAVAVVELGLDGTIQRANANFLRVMGYAAHEVEGQHHSLFVDPAHARSAEYQRLWDDLRSGRPLVAEVERLGRGRRRLWIQANYCPVRDASGRVTRIVKIAADVTARRLRAADQESQLEALGRSLAVIEFDLDGTILEANDNFTRAMGYSLDEIRGRKHAMFVEPAHARSAEYQRFWDDLRAGEFKSAEFRRLGRGGREVWIQATYNPVLGIDGTPTKVVKFATDITEVKRRTAAEVSARLAEASTTLLHAANQVSAGATQTVSQSTAVASAAEQMRGNVASVAAASEELAFSIREIARNSSDSARTARNARELASSASTTITALSSNAAAIGEVTHAIQTIAQHTSILALNASIEAARAGDAGKGFMVVANEVKELARQTDRATAEIARHITSIQSDTAKSVESISSVVQVVERIDGYASSIAAAVEEQAATVRDVARHATEVATAVASVVDNINGVSAAARDAARTAADTQRAAASLDSLAAESGAAARAA